MKSFIEKSLDIYTISPNGTHVGLLHYGDNAEVKLYLNEGNEKSTVIRGINFLSLRGGTRRMEEALKAATRIFSTKTGSRQDASKVLVLLTAGMNDISGKSQIPEAAKQLKAAGVKVIVVDIDSKDNPDAENVVDNLDKLIKSDSDDLIDKIGTLEKEIGKSIGK